MDNSDDRCRVVLFSSTQFGQQCLEKGILPCPDITLSGIITTPHTIRVTGGNDKLEIASPADFGPVGMESSCEIITLEDKPDEKDYLDILDRLKPDIAIALGWYYLLPSSVIAYPRLGTVAVHASLLPRYRGMAPIPWAILNGEKTTGVTLFYLDHTIDGGDIIAQAKMSIEGNDDCSTVYAKATELSISLLREYLPLLALEDAPREKQNDAEATQFPRRRPKDGLIDWYQPVERVYDFVRAQTRPYPGAFTYVDGRKVHIWKARIIDRVDKAMIPGQITCDGGRIEIAAQNGAIRVLESQSEGPNVFTHGAVCGMNVYGEFEHTEETSGIETITP